MVIEYKYADANGYLDITQLLSDRIKETTYHELTHAVHYSALGNTWYTSLVNAEEYENEFGLSGYKPYGDGVNTTYSPIIALGEAWGFHMGHFLEDQRYGVNSSCSDEGQTLYCPVYPTNPHHTHIEVLENFNPYFTSDPIHWIPIGLMEDLIDNTPTETWVNDQVSGFTIAQIFNAYQNNVTTVQQYKTTLINQNPTLPGGTTITQLNNLFSSYNY